MKGVFILLTIVFCFSFSLDNPSVLIEKCLSQKKFKACKKIAEAYFIVGLTAEDLGYDYLDFGDFVNTYRFFMSLSCEYGNIRGCMEIMSFQISYVKHTLNYILDRESELIKEKNQWAFTLIIEEYKRTKYIHSIACSDKKTISVISMLSKSYKESCNELHSYIQQLKGFMIRHIGLEEEYINKINTPKKFPLPNNMKHLLEYK